MPVIPVQSVAPYQTVGDVLQMARVFVNDAAGPNGITGDLLAGSQPATPVLLNSAWRSIQDELADAGVESLVKEIVIESFPACTSNDLADSVWIDWTGTFDGTNNNDSPVLPSDLIVPKAIYERSSGTNDVFTPVYPVDGGLPERQRGSSLGNYEWRNDKVFFKGASSVRDLRVRYLAYYSDFATTDGAVDESEVVPIMRVARAMAYHIASEYARPRGAAIADNLYAMAEAEVKKLTSRTARTKASVPYRRQAYGA